MAKQFSLSQEEKSNLAGRENALKYIKSCIQDEMTIYINEVVKKRLGLKAEDLIEVDIAKGEITLIEKQPADSTKGK